MISLGATAATVQTQVLDAGGTPLTGAVVFLDSPEAARAAKPMAGAEMGQQGKAFAPDLLVVTRGTAVSFPNRDTVRHHVYSFSPIKKFELKLYGREEARTVTFDKPGVATLGCNIHDRMSAHVVVVDTPTFARTDDRGQASFDLPPGEHAVKAWHAGQKSPTLQALKLDVPAAGGAVTLTLAE